MITRIILLFSALLTSACAQNLTKEDLSQINRVAVVNLINNDMSYFNRGLTVFGNSSSTTDISEFRLSEYITERTIATASRNHPRIKFTHALTPPEVLNQHGFPHPDFFDQLKNQNYDTVLIISNAGIFSNTGSGSYIAPREVGGFIFFTTSFAGNTFRTQLLPQFSYSLKRLSDDKYLKFSTNNTEYPKFINSISVKPFEDYSTEEKEIIRKEFIKNIDESLEKNVIRVFTPISRTR